MKKAVSHKKKEVHLVHHVETEKKEPQVDRILIETDTPFAAPVPYRGKRNEPAYVEFVARKIAEWKKLSFEEVARQTVKNTIDIFKIKLP